MTYRKRVPGSATLLRPEYPPLWSGCPRAQSQYARATTGQHSGCFYLASTASPYGFQCVKRYRYSVVGSKATAALCRLPATTDISAVHLTLFHLFVRLYLGKSLKEELLRGHIRAGICSLLSYRQQEITLYWPHGDAANLLI